MCGSGGQQLGRRNGRMALPAQKNGYTFADVLSLEGDERIELINGEAYRMATPSRIHQGICFEIGRQLGNYLEGKQCRAYPAPFAVRLFEQDGERPEEVDSVVEPDISVVCDRGKLDKYGCRGAPDMVVEVLSPSSLRHDRLVKLNLYQQAGVREYWIVDPENRSVQVFLLDSSGFFRICEDYGCRDVAKVNVLDGCFIELAKVFSE